jgi:AraC-like DNA-binding protein
MGQKVYAANRVVFGSGTRGGHRLIPEILEIGWGDFPAADCGHLRRHVHEGAFEICLILSGEVEWSGTHGLNILRPGDAYLTQPTEAHWGRDATMHPCSLYWLIVGSPSHGAEWPETDGRLATHLDRRLCDIPTNRIRGTERLGELFRSLFEEHRNADDAAADAILRQACARAALHSLLIELVRAYERRTAFASHRSEPDSSFMMRAVEVLHQNAHDPHIAHRVSEIIHADFDTLNREFIRHSGVTIAQYWLREKVRLARDQLLREGVTVTDVATQFGFSSSQHFATVFRKITGLTPSDYRNQNGSGATNTGRISPSQTPRRRGHADTSAPGSFLDR